MLIDSLGKKVENLKLKDRDIILYGASTRNQSLITEMQIEDNVLFFVDSDERKSGQVMGNYQIKSVETLKDYKECIVMSVLLAHYTDVMETLHKVGIDYCIFYLKPFFNIQTVCDSNNIIIQKKRDYRYLHIFSNHIFVIPFYQMLEEQFDIEEHLLIVSYRLCDDCAGVLEYVMNRNEIHQNVLIMDDVHAVRSDLGCDRLLPMELDCNKIFYSNDMEKICSNVKKILLHSAFWGIETKNFLNRIVKKQAHKMEWICFGGDTNFDISSFEVKEILQKIGKAYAFKSRVASVQKKYKIAVKETGILYTYIFSKKYLNNCNNSKHYVNILLGHSAAEYIDHEYGFQLLKKYNNEDIRIYCPLSYGNRQHADKVILMGKEVFGEKFIPMTQFMDFTQYYEFLLTIDIAIFPMHRHAAGTTISYLDAIGKKIYLFPEMVDAFSLCNIFAYNIDSIKNLSFEEFVKNSSSEESLLKRINELNEKTVSGWKQKLMGGAEG